MKRGVHVSPVGKETSAGGIHIIGLDIGYGVTKAVLSDEKLAVFPSVCGHAREIKFKRDELAQKYPGDQISDDDGGWFVGDLALTQVPTGELLKLQGRTANDDSGGNAFRARMAKAAIGKLFAGRMNGDVVHLSVATGLPVDHMPDAPALKQALIGQHLIQTDSAHFVANITEVMVMPQPYGTIYANMLTEAGDLNPCHTATRTGVVDVGNHTIDLALDDNGEYIDAESGSVEAGVHTAQQRIAAVLEQDYREKFPYRTIETVLRTGCLKAFGESRDYNREVKDALMPLRDATLALMAVKWRTGAAVDVIYLSGGGAALLQQPIKAAYRQARLVENAQLSNARGYLNYARFVARG